MYKICLLLAAVMLTAGTVLAQAQTNNVEQRVAALLGRMTLEEKIDLLGGINGFEVRGVPRLGVPLMKAADSPFGVRSGGRSNVMAGGIALAATWNTLLAAQTGTQVGRDARARGVSFSLGPGVNIYRSPLNGRNFEYYGEDPFLASRLAVGYIKGLQSQGVAATIKHFLGNNSEFARHTSDSVIDERALREIYLPVFEAAVKEAEVGAIMDSYNLVNGAHLTQNGYFNNDILKQEWGFTGIVMSDWDSTYDAPGAANGGLDLEMPSGRFLNREKLLPLLQAGLVTPATIDDKVRRILRVAARFGWLDRPQADPAIPRYNQAGQQVALQGARESLVLLKNDNNLLPLNKQKIKSVAVIGPNAYPAVLLGGGSASILPFHAVSSLEGLSNYLGAAANVHYARGLPNLSQVANSTNFTDAATNGKPGLRAEVFNNLDLSGTPASLRTDRHINQGELLDLGVATSGEIEYDFSTPHPAVATRWTGYYTPSTAGEYDICVHQGGFGFSGYRLYVDGKLVKDSWNSSKAALEETKMTLDAVPHEIKFEFHSEGGITGPFIRLGIVRQGTWVDAAAVELAAKADVVVLTLGFDANSETEGWDRTFALPPGQAELIRKIAAANKNTVVVVIAGGAVDMNGWLEKVPALVYAWFPGQEGGTALAEVLFGEVNPSGRLPATFERRWEDNPTAQNYFMQSGSNKIEYKEGIFVGYRGYEKNGVKPQFPFGYGLSYTTFKYGNLQVKPVGATNFVVSFDVTNTGNRAGAAVPQLYIGASEARVARPAKELKGFSKLMLQPKETQRVTLPLDFRALAYYDVKNKQWQADAGTYAVLVGSSSAEIALTGKLTLAAAATSGKK